MDRTGTPAKYWPLCLEYAVYVLNHTCEVRDTKTPLDKAHGQKADVSALMQFRWFAPVLYHTHDASFASQLHEKLGRWVGVATNIGDALTYLILDDASQQVIPRSVVRSALNPQHPNLRSASAPVQDGEESGGTVESSGTAIITSVRDMLSPSIDPAQVALPTFLLACHMNELLGKTFLYTTQNGEQVKAQVVISKINDLDAADHQNIKFVIDVADGEYEDIISYVKLCQVMSSDVT